MSADIQSEKARQTGGHSANPAVHARYERSADGLLCVDVATDRAEDLYNDFDRNAPYIRRDLDQDLVDYLVDSVTELVPEPFAIRFTFAQAPDEATYARIRNSIATFFTYLAAKEKALRRRTFTRAWIFLVAGLVILIGTVLLRSWAGDQSNVVANAVAEGVNVAAWVALWEALAVFLVEWFPLRRELRVYRALAAAPVLFR